MSTRRALTHAADIPLVVLSFDGYRDIWRPFFAMLRRNWPDCPLPTVLVTNSIEYDDASVRTVRTGPETSWATHLARALETIGTDYVLLVLEDFLIYEPVDTAEVMRLGQVALDEQVAFLRLAPNPPPSDVVARHPDLGAVRPDDPYRINAQVAFWHVETLLSLLRPEYRIWDFEFHASAYGPVPRRPMWSRWEPAISYRDCISRGRWMPWGIETCRKAGLSIELDARPRMTGRLLWAHYYARLRGFVFARLPRSVQRRRWKRIVDRALAGSR